MLKKRVKINYLTKDVERSWNNEHQHTKFVSEIVEGRSTKRYHNTIGILVSLSKCARLLLDYVLEVMDEENNLSNDRLLKSGLNEILKKTGQSIYGPVTINKAFIELTNANLLLSGKKGTYKVSPWFFFNGSEKKRQQLIRRYLEKPNAALIAESRRQNYMENED